jgi:uncharacterized membrane protein
MPYGGTVDVDDATVYESSYSFADHVLSEFVAVDDSLVHKVSWKAQVKETRDLIRRHGIQGAAVLNNGQIRFTSRRARREFLRMRGLHDLDGTFGDG